MTPLEHRATPLVTPTRVLVAVLLVLPFIATLWVSSYSHVGPRLGGFPFFYWYQLLWIILSVICTYSAFVLVQREKRANAGTSHASRRGGTGREGEVR
jgi:hypothetical protein